MMTRKFHSFATLLILFVAVAPLSQAPAARIEMAEKAWAGFWDQFTSAINNKDHGASLRMMPSDFSDGGGGLTGRQWLKFIDENEAHGSWRDLRKSMSGGAKTNRTWSAKGMPTKVTNDNAYYFEFRKDEKWYFAGVVGD